ncbi:MAG: hypothetical protein AABY22_05165 [Nanoarchaeota archaeon]
MNNLIKTKWDIVNDKMHCAIAMASGGAAIGTYIGSYFNENTIYSLIVAIICGIWGFTRDI